MLTTSVVPQARGVLWYLEVTDLNHPREESRNPFLRKVIGTLTMQGKDNFEQDERGGRDLLLAGFDTEQQCAVSALRKIFASMNRTPAILSNCK
jgi:hypothetical protein